MPYMPSIFDESELVKNLLDIAAPRVKEAQVVSSNPEEIKSIAKKLADKLSAATSITADKPDTGLYIRDLQNLDSLIGFLNINGVKFHDKFIVQPNYDKINPEEKSLYVPFKWNGGVDAMPLNSTLAIYKDGLTEYLKDLQSKANDMGGASGQLLTTMIGKLIDSANTSLKTKIDHEAIKAAPASSSQEGVQPVLMDNQPLDSINGIISLDNPLSPPRDQGNIVITPKDLKDKMSFDEFAKKIKVSKDGKVYDYEQNTSESFFCDIINSLHTRAVNYSYRRGVYVDKAYLKLITDLANQYQCTLVTKHTTNEPTGAGPGPSPHGSGLTPAILQQLASLQPFNSQYISFPEITNFLDKYTALANDAAVTNVADEVKRYISNFKSLLGVSSDTVQMYNLTTSQFKSWLKNPATAQIAAGNLYDIVHYTGVLYQRMLTSLQTIAKDPRQLPATAYRAMQQQVVPGGPQLTNISTINQLKYNLQQEWQKK